MLNNEEYKIAKELFAEKMGNFEFQKMIRSKSFGYGMRVAKDCIAKNFPKQAVRQEGKPNA